MYGMTEEKIRAFAEEYAKGQAVSNNIINILLSICLIAFGAWLFFSAGEVMDWNRWTHEWYELNETQIKVQKIIGGFIMAVGLICVFLTVFR